MDRSCVMQLNSLVEGNQEFRRSSMLHIMVLLKFLGSYGNEAALEKLGLMLGISKGSVNNYVRQACNAILKHCEQLSSGQVLRNDGISVAGSERLMVLLIA